MTNPRMGSRAGLKEAIEDFRKSLVAQTGPEAGMVQTQAPMPEPSDFECAVRHELWQIGSMLIDKNTRYGNSALNPMRLFSRASPVEQILVRIDDKLSRVREGVKIQDQEDVTLDLVGYLILLRLAQRHRHGTG